MSHGPVKLEMLRKLWTLEASRRALLRRLSGTEELAVGTVSWADRRCGRPSWYPLYLRKPS